MADETNGNGGSDDKKGFLSGANGGKSSNRLMAVGVTYILLIMIVIVQFASVAQAWRKGWSITVVDVSMTVVLLLLSAYAPKLAETITEIFKK